MEIRVLTGGLNARFEGIGRNDLLYVVGEISDYLSVLDYLGLDCTIRRYTRIPLLFTYWLAIVSGRASSDVSRFARSPASPSSSLLHSSPSPG